jgi:4-oxalocrotonate tautomerase
MPHVIVKLWPGKSEQQKQKLAEGITKVVMSSLGYGEESVSVSLQEVAPDAWTAEVYQPDIVDGPGQLYKRPGYKPF